MTHTPRGIGSLRQGVTGVMKGRGGSGGYGSSKWGPTSLKSRENLSDEKLELRVGDQEETEAKDGPGRGTKLTNHGAFPAPHPAGRCTAGLPAPRPPPGCARTWAAVAEQHVGCASHIEECFSPVPTTAPRPPASPRTPHPEPAGSHRPGKVRGCPTLVFQSIWSPPPGSYKLLLPTLRAHPLPHCLSPLRLL